MKTIEEFQQFLDQTLDGDCRLSCTMQTPPSSAAVAQLNQAFGLPIPGDFLAFQRRFGAAFFEVKESVWPRPKAYAAGPYWSFLYACLVFGIGEGVPEFLDIHAATSKVRTDFGQWIPFPVVPLMKWVGSADYICCDAQGRIFEISHETPAEPELQSGGFLDCLSESIRTLVRNKSRLKTEAAFLFETDEDRLAKRRAAAEKDATMTARRCPNCNSPFPTYRKTCKVCGHAPV